MPFIFCPISCRPLRWASLTAARESRVPAASSPLVLRSLSGSIVRDGSAFAPLDDHLDHDAPGVGPRLSGRHWPLETVLHLCACFIHLLDVQWVPGFGVQAFRVLRSGGFVEVVPKIFANLQLENFAMRFISTSDSSGGNHFEQGHAPTKRPRAARGVAQAPFDRVVGVAWLKGTDPLGEAPGAVRDMSEARVTGWGRRLDLGCRRTDDLRPATCWRPRPRPTKRFCRNAYTFAGAARLVRQKAEGVSPRFGPVDPLDSALRMRDDRVVEGPALAGGETPSAEKKAHP